MGNDSVTKDVETLCKGIVLKLLVLIYVCFIADERRKEFLQSLMLKFRHCPFQVRRNHILDDVLALYKSHDILEVHPFRVEFIGERAIDIGGVARDLFSAVFEAIYEKFFDGCSVFCPVVHPGMDVSALRTIGIIFSHAFLETGLLATRVAFPCLAQMLLGLSIVISEATLSRTFLYSISSHEDDIMKCAFAEMKNGAHQFSQNVFEALMLLLSRFNIREVPSPKNLKETLINVAYYEFIAKPASALAIIHSGVPSQHKAFWKSLNISFLQSVYQAQCVSTIMVLKMFENAEGYNETEERMLNYLRQFIGSMSQEELHIFLRFVTGGAACSSNQVGVTFNSLAGVQRRPIAHTCSPSLELSTTYISYTEFVSEFKACLCNQYSWIMDSL